MPSAAIKDLPFIEHITDRSLPMSKEQGQAYLTEIRAMLNGHVLTSEIRQTYNSALGVLLIRLGRPEEAIEYLTRVVDTRKAPGDFNNLGCAHLDAGELEEAILRFVEASRKILTETTSSEFQVTVWGNLAEAQYRSGFQQEAFASMQRALDALDPSERFEHFLIAIQLAEVDLHAEATEFFARWLAMRDGIDMGEESAVDLLLRLRGKYEDALRDAPRLRYSVRFVLAFEEANRVPEESSSGGSDGALAMLEATRSMRERATKAILDHEGAPS